MPLAVQDGANYPRVRLGVPPAQVVERRSLKPEALRLRLEGPDVPVIRFGDDRLARDRQFVEPVNAMYHPRALRTEGNQSAGYGFDERRMPDADHLEWRARRVGQGAEKVEGGRDAQLAPHARDAGRRAVIERRIHEAYAYLVEASLGDL